MSMVLWHPGSVLMALGHARAGPILCLLWHGMVGDVLSLPLATCGAEVRRAEELSLPLSDCSTQESGPYTLPGQHRGAGSSGRGVGEPAPRT